MMPSTRFSFSELGVGSDQPAIWHPREKPARPEVGKSIYKENRRPKKLLLFSSQYKTQLSFQRSRKYIESKYVYDVVQCLLSVEEELRRTKQ